MPLGGRKLINNSTPGKEKQLQKVLRALCCRAVGYLKGAQRTRGVTNRTGK